MECRVGAEAVELMVELFGTAVAGIGCLAGVVDQPQVVDSFGVLAEVSVGHSERPVELVEDRVVLLAGAGGEQE